MEITGSISPAPRAPSPNVGHGRPASASHEASESARPALAQGAFWDLLTPDERTFFVQQGALGPLTYGPRAARSTRSPGPLGQRVDVKG
jgi:hypothetical protein